MSQRRAKASWARQVSNDEIADAPLSAHVKRTAQESFEPPAFVLRRSMPYGGIAEHGLYFIAYGESLDRFERQLRRMAGRDDGIVDGLMAFTKAVTGGIIFVRRCWGIGSICGRGASTSSVALGFRRSIGEMRQLRSPG